jgi:glycosyltransferase involved in cell wall biosynthesis
MLRCADGESCGILVPPARPERLAEVLLALAGDPLLRGRLGTRARARAADYSADEEWRNYRKLYDEIASRG